LTTDTHKQHTHFVKWLIPVSTQLTHAHMASTWLHSLTHQLSLHDSWCVITGPKITETITFGAGSINCIVAFAASEGKSGLKKKIRI